MKNERNNGITLIALVVTIIVLLILAGISISMLSGDNGILQRATQSKEKTERAEIVENAKLDILAKISEKKGENLTASELEEILISPDYSTQGTLSNEENILERTLTSKDEKYEIPVSEIYNGNLKTSQPAIITPKTISFNIYNPSLGEDMPCTVDEGQTWYEWAVATKDDESQYIYCEFKNCSLQQYIIELYNEDEAYLMEVEWSGDHWSFGGPLGTCHVNDEIIENGYYSQSYWSEM